MTEAPQGNRIGRRMRSDTEKLRAEARAIRELRTNATVSVMTLADALQVGKERAYAAVQNGHVPSICLGAEWRIPSAPILALLGLAPDPNSGPAPQLKGGS